MISGILEIRMEFYHQGNRICLYQGEASKWWYVCHHKLKTGTTDWWELVEIYEYEHAVHAIHRYHDEVVNVVLAS